MTREEAKAGVLLFEAAVAEAGYPNANAHVIETAPGDWFIRFYMSMPPEIAYKAGVLLALMLGRPHSCWDCWSPSYGNDADTVDRCRNGNCPHEQVSA